MSSKAQTTDEYIVELQGMLAVNPTCASHHYNLGVAFLAKRMWQEAEEAFRDAVEHSPRMAEAHVQLGGICLQRGDIDGCLNYNKHAKGCRPQFAVPFANMGFCYLQKGDVDRAIVNLKKALNRDPDFIQALATYGSALIMDGELEEAKKHLDKALKIQPAFGPAWNNLALYWLEKGDKDQARECIKKAQETGFEVAEELVKEIG
ncbi:tetratricopeptide repeat protein [Desulfovibrio ferrophilus]|uniref:TPR repeats containing protein n=1 Tax=Desulfovibrio ferrophilus TaxID=241368 RepID=A0A2Z6B2S5_9BACT|nr:tetratricopeptide repeat protein [Desulfovibrio ferrophilus]BBD09791.1 TPR repeats containing protein [Desulfovibrio ferrophilus]